MGQQQFQQYQTAAKNIFSEAVGAFIAIWKKPIDTGRSFCMEGKIGVSIVFIVLQAICTGLFMDAAMGSVMYIAGALLGSYSSFLNYIHLPYFRAFLVTMIIMVVFSFIMGLLIWGIGQIFRNKLSFSQALGVVGVKSVILSPVMLLACLMSFLNVNVALVLAALCFEFGLIVMTAVLPTSQGGNHNMAVYIMGLALICNLIVAYFVIPKAAMFYVPSNPSSMVDGLDDYDWDDLF